MVQGMPAVDWKSVDNNTKLFAAVLASCGTPDNNKIAKFFGACTSLIVAHLLSFDHLIYC